MESKLRRKEEKKKIFENWFASFQLLVNAWNENTNSLDFIPDGMYYILATSD